MFDSRYNGKMCARYVVAGLTNSKHNMLKLMTLQSFEVIRKTRFGEGFVKKKFYLLWSLDAGLQEILKLLLLTNRLNEVQRRPWMALKLERIELNCSNFNTEASSSPPNTFSRFSLSGQREVCDNNDIIIIFVAPFREFHHRLFAVEQRRMHFVPGIK